MLSVTTQGKDLLDSKSFLALDLGETIVSLGDGTETLKFILDFMEDKDKKLDMEVIEVDRKTLRIKLINWNNSFGTTFNEPLEAGAFQGRKLFIVIFVQKAGRKGQMREVTFSAYLGEGRQDGAH